jgi:N-acetylglucosamine-6-sulfatase
MRLLAALLTALLLANAAEARPNFIVFLIDDQEDTGSMGYMPKTISLLADHGVTFSNSFVNYPVCAPSRSSFLTGQAAHNHGVQSNNPGGHAAWWTFKERGENTLPVWLKAAGYKTALLGKYVNGYGKKEKDQRSEKKRPDSFHSLLGRLEASFGQYLSGGKANATSVGPVPQGWDLWYAFTGAVRYYDYAINESGKRIEFEDRASDYSTDVLKDRAVRFIESQTGERDPFFMLIAPKAVHGEGEEGKAEHAAIPSPKYQHAFMDVGLPKGPAFNNPPSERLDAEVLEKEYRAGLQSLQSVDDLVEAVMDALQKTDRLDNTIIVYTSDNGFLFGDHGKRAKGVFYEGAIRVPLIIRGPGIPEKQKREQLVNNLDVVATIEQLARLTPGLKPDGQSLLPLFDYAGAQWRDALLLETKSGFAVRTATRKYVKYNGGAEELYDLAADPHELENRTGDAEYESDLASLRSSLGRLKECSGASCWVPSPGIAMASIGRAPSLYQYSELAPEW